LPATITSVARLIDVDGAEHQRALGRHFLQAVHAGGGLLGHADDHRALARVPGRVLRQLGLDGGEQAGLFLAARVGQHRGVLLGALAQVHQQRGVAAVVEDHVRAFAVAALGPEFEDAVGVVPVVGQRLALVGKNRRALGHQRSGRMVLCAEDVARGPAHLRAQCLQRFHQHGGLDGHVQAAGDARALERLGLGELFADRHQTGHFGLGDADLLAAPGGKRKVGDVEVGEILGFEHSVQGILR
jgi:hypothetical protein